MPLVENLGPVARNLASKKTDFGGFFHGLESFSSALVPVARTQADLYANLDTTFTALASVAVPFLQQWISDTPPTFSAVIATSPHIQAFLNNTAGLFKALRPGFATLPQSAPVLADAFAAGARNLPGTTALDQQLLSLAQHLESYGQTPAVNAGLDRLTLTASSLRSPLAFLTPVQSSCNYVTLFLRNIASTLSDDVITGTALRFNLVVIDDMLGGEGVPSQRPYTTPQTEPGPIIGPIHVNPYPNTDSPGQTPECAAGNERYSGQGGADRESAGERRAEDRDDNEAEDVRRHQPRVSSFAAGIIGLVVVAAACYLIFGGALPFSGSPFVLKAVFTSETQLHIPSPVRIAGVDVGEVTSVTHIQGSSAGLITMDINKNGLPIHADATAQIRSRIFLEGNFYVDLAPGTPNAPVLSSGSTLPAAEHVRSGPARPRARGA